MKRRKPWLMYLGLAYLAALVLFALFGPMIRTGQLFDIAKSVDPTLRTFDSVTDRVSARPFQEPGGALMLGTDELGRDIVSRLAQGARVSLFVGFAVQFIAVSVGILFGVMGVMGPKWLRSPLNRFTDGMFAFPDILLAVLIVALLGPRMEAVIVALSITAWPSVARLVATQVASIKDREYVVAAKAAGASTWYQVTRHIIPQLTGVLLAVSTVNLAGTILAESTLSFIGIGVQDPMPSWGNMTNQARLNMASYPTLLIWPCAIISLTIFALNFVGDGLLAIVDPKGDR